MKRSYRIMAILGVLACGTGPFLNAANGADKNTVNQAASHLNLARRYMRTSNGYNPKVVSELRQVLRLQPNNPEAIAMLAYQYRINGRTLEAVQLWRKIENRQDRFGIAAQAGLIGAYNSGNPTTARAAIRRNPNDAPAHMSLAHYYIQQGKAARPQAIQELREVVRIEPDNGEATYLLASQLDGIGKQAESTRLLTKLARKDDVWGKMARKRLNRREVSH